jgi:hypothetical protein
MDILQANSNAVMSKAGNPERLLMVKQDREYYTGGGQILRGSRLISVNLVYSDNPCDCCQWNDPVYADNDEVQDFCHTRCKR